jgi:ribosome-associated protein
VCSERKGTLATPAVSRASARRAPDSISKVRPDAEEILRLVLARIDDMKAEDTVTIDLTGKTSIADAMVVTSGRSNRQVGAIADRLRDDLAKAGVPNLRVEGMPHCDWVLIDAGDVIVHVFRPEVRAFYNLEKMWASARTRGRQASALSG